ncbi:uncharacterized protein BDR25DRAFT_382300 [Lindgomyces ingoldianus]|uniref:Uncharacterized protein n=1 Tax=Lindgomyces ingoldianus TaxID=673940 RepID=A0ACB6R8D4_9PLEO|nr:uncharacterized protein BDR25DRAFT_382300 [Lindgomyces ingoldianus]KAF2475352.1 hypothetical protein BDR25DRAFT_382300 [Lindgomyces ingoldianus]
MGLASLPTELVETVVNHLDLPAFQSFRLISPSLNQQSLHLFKTRFFRTRTISWTVEDFRCLLDIAWHPVFGGALQDLIVDATPKYAIQLWEVKKRIYDAQHDSKLKDLYWIEYELLNEKAAESYRYWNETRHDQKTLTAIFERLKKLDSILFCYNGMCRSYGKFSRRYCESSQNEMSRPFVSTLAAIAVSGIIVHEISVHPQRRHGAISVGRLESLSPILSRFDAAFEHLRVLKLNLRDWRHPDEGFEPPPGKVPFVVRFLSKCRNLRELEFSWYSLLERGIFVQVARHCRFASLQVCKLELFSITAEDVMAFLQPTKKTLRDLTFTNVILRDADSTWEVLLPLLTAEFDLEHLSLQDLFTNTGGMVIFRSYEQSAATEVAITSTAPGINAKVLHLTDRLATGNLGPAWSHGSVAYPFIGRL